MEFAQQTPIYKAAGGITDNFQLDQASGFPYTGNMSDYSNRTYLSAIEVSSYLGIKVRDVHELIKEQKLPATVSGGGQYRINLAFVQKIEAEYKEAKEIKKRKKNNKKIKDCLAINRNDTVQKVFLGNSQNMDKLEDNSVHLAITSPPYFNAKMYSHDKLSEDLGNVNDMEQWFAEIAQVWKEVYRVLQSGRKFFLNIMNLPIRENGRFRALNLVGKSIDLCESIGFVFKRDIIWQKTNGVRAHFGTYPYPGGILINNMH